MLLNHFVEIVCKGYEDLSDITEAIAVYFVYDYEDIEVYFRLYLILYAGDTVVLVEPKEQLQACIEFNVFILPNMEIRIQSFQNKIRYI